MQKKCLLAILAIMSIIPYQAMASSAATDSNQSIPLGPPHYTERPPEIYFVSPAEPHSLQEELQSEGSNGSVSYYSTSVRHNLTLFLDVDAMHSPNGDCIQLTNVSYKASWQKDPIVLYENPSIHEFGIPNHYNESLMFFKYNLTIPDVPEGNQQLEITAVKEGILANWPDSPLTYSSFVMTSSAVLKFNSTVPSDNSSSWQTNQNLILLIVVIAALAAFLAVLLIIFRGHQKTANLER